MTDNHSLGLSAGELILQSSIKGNFPPTAPETAWQVPTGVMDYTVAPAGM